MDTPTVSLLVENGCSHSSIENCGSVQFHFPLQHLKTPRIVAIYACHVS